MIWLAAGAAFMAALIVGWRYGRYNRLPLGIADLFTTPPAEPAPPLGEPMACTRHEWYPPTPELAYDLTPTGEWMQFCINCDAERQADDETARLSRVRSDPEPLPDQTGTRHRVQAPDAGERQ